MYNVKQIFGHLVEEGVLGSFHYDETRRASLGETIFEPRKRAFFLFSRFFFAIVAIATPGRSCFEIRFTRRGAATAFVSGKCLCDRGGGGGRDPLDPLRSKHLLVEQLGRLFFNRGGFGGTERALCP